MGLTIFWPLSQKTKNLRPQAKLWAKNAHPKTISCTTLHPPRARDGVAARGPLPDRVRGGKWAKCVVLHEEFYRWISQGV